MPGALRTNQHLHQSVSVSLAAVLLVALSACGKDSESSSAGGYSVKAGDKECTVEKPSIPAGKVTFQVENTGSDVTEVYVYGRDGDEFSKIIGEVENIGPGTSQDFSVDLTAGDYEVACKPGMVGDGIRAPLTVTGDEASGEAEEAVYDREIEIEVASSGEVSTVAASSLAGTVGEKIEFKLENESDTEHYLVLSGPDGAKVDEAEAGPDSVAEFIAELSVEGDHTISVYPEDAEDKTVDQTLSVTAS